jgi:cell division protein FtsL
MSQKKSSSYNWAPIIIVLILVILIFAVVILPAWKKFNISKELDSHETLAERQARINLENEGLKSKVAELGITQIRLTRRFIWAYSTFVLGFLITMGGVQIGLFYLLKYFNLGNLWFWDGGIAATFLILYTLITRKKFSFYELVKYFESKIKNAVYGDLINIEEDIKKIEDKIAENNQELDAIAVPAITTIIIPEKQSGENNHL